MSEAPSRLVIGIDLGTTNTVVAASDADVGVLEVLIPQWTAPQQQSALPSLPSVLLARSDAEAEDAANHPQSSEWGDARWIVGEWARRRAAEQPSRAVVSAKSWLCHDGVDRDAAILPWQRDAKPESEARISPVEASRRILQQAKAALLQRYGSALLDARIVLTIPASFDQVARVLTLRAASDVGWNVELLEEPQAAFYDAVVGSSPRALTQLLDGKDFARVLVIDVGGGTTDLALFEMKRDAGRLHYTRLSVGRHLLLGGDNIDLALAARIEAQLGEKLEGVQASQLLLATRAAKERLLNEELSAVPIALARQGASLVGATLRTELTRATLEEVLFDGFLPEVSLQQLETRPRRAHVLRGLGLPYEREPAITRHLLEFILRQRAEYGDPDLLLFNGGLFHSELLRQRVVHVLEGALGRKLKLIANERPGSAVARGAVVFGQARAGDGVLIEARSPHAYYVGLGGKQQGRAVCVIPRGAAEREVFQPEQELALALGRTVQFDLYVSQSGGHRVGEIRETTLEKFQRLPPLKVTLPAKLEGGGTSVPVRLSGQLSSVGTLKINANELGSNGISHALEFELRADTQELDVNSSRAVRSVDAATLSAEAREALARVYGKGRADVGPREAKDLVRELERLLGPRPEWRLATLRELSDVLLTNCRARRRSKDHERTYFQLLGYALRPGFGASGDEARAEQVGALFQEGLAFDDERKQWEAFLIAYRRLVGGLNETHQVQIRQRIDPFIAPSELKLKKPKNFRPQGDDELLWLAVNLERVTVHDRAALGQWLLEKTWTSRQPQYWELLARVGARVPLYASAHYVVEARSVERWLEHLLSENWANLSIAPRVAASLARFTDDRERDVPVALRKELANRMSKVGAPETLSAMLLHYVPVGAAERLAALADDLPQGLTLAE